MTYARHTLDIYGAELYLATNRRDWATLRRKVTYIDKTAPASAGQASFAVWQPNDGGLHRPVIVLWVDLAAHRDDHDLVDTLAHEATHAAGALLDHIGHDSHGIDEPHAYLVGWLTAWMWDHCKTKQAS